MRTYQLLLATVAVLTACDSPVEPASRPRPSMALSTGDITITALPALAGVDEWAEDINDRGEIVGGALASDDTYHAIRWSAAGIQDLGNFGGVEAYALAINELGHFVVYTGPQTALLASGNDLTPIPVSGQAVGVQGLNDLSQVTGHSSQDSRYWSSFLWAPGSPPRDLGTLGGYVMFARDINNHGQIAGWGNTAAFQSRAFVWSEQTGVTMLPLPAGAQMSFADGINNAGQVAGTISYGSGQRPALWTLPSEVTDLGLPPGLSSASPVAINDAGEIVGWGYGQDLLQRAWLRTSDGEYHLLPDLGGGISFATGINNLGQIVGTAMTADGKLRAVTWNTRRIQPTPAEQIAQLVADVGELEAAGHINRGQANSLRAKLDAASSHLEAGRPTPAINVLQAFVQQVSAFVAAGILTAADGAALEETATAVIAAIQ